jgi:glycosyltransferase involved in cell wall biosynthesis
VHNRYLQSGGEDAVFAAEKTLLSKRGHSVKTYTDDNQRLIGMSKLAIAQNAIWSSRTKKRLQAYLHEEKPDIVHFHNTFSLISPSAYYACQDLQIPVVQTLHNYRLVCPAATLYRDHRTCEDCLGKSVPWPGILHRCYHSSAVESAAVASMLSFHKMKNTWCNAVDLYIALTNFSRQKFISGGLPEDKIVVKPNFVHPDPGSKKRTGDYILFVGRLSEEKGLRTLLQAWRSIPDIPLKIAGGGPLLSELQSMTSADEFRQVEILGSRPHDEILRLLNNARLLIFPSEWYEGFPMTIVEAFACGVPVLGSNIGSTAEIIEEGQNGLLFKSGDPEDLAENARIAWDQTHTLKRMGAGARKIYENQYTAEENYRTLISIYKRAQEIHDEGQE